MSKTIDKKAIKNKAFVMSTIMRDNKLSKILHEAWDSPVGSTKNTKAKSILKSLNKTHQNYNSIMDGMGGPGGPVINQNPLEAFVQSITKNDQQKNPATLSSGATVPTPQPTAQTGPASMPAQQDITTPNITKEQVENAFKSFGYQPDLNNMNDTGYWMTKPVTEISKLISELRKRREKDNANLEEQGQKLDIEKRLDPDRIKQIYDRYGLSEQIKDDDDINRIQNILPNDEDNLTKILEEEQKRKLGEYKETLSPKIKNGDGKGGYGPKKENGQGGYGPKKEDGQGGPGDVNNLTPQFSNPLGDLLRSIQPNASSNKPFSNISIPTTAQPEQKTPNMSGFNISGSSPDNVTSSNISPILSSISGLKTLGPTTSTAIPQNLGQLSTPSARSEDDSSNWTDIPPVIIGAGIGRKQFDYSSAPLSPGNKFVYNKNTGERKEVPIYGAYGLATSGEEKTFKEIAGDYTTPSETVSQQTTADQPGAIRTFPDGTYTYVNKDGSVHTGQQGDNYVDKTGIMGPPAPTYDYSELADKVTETDIGTEPTTPWYDESTTGEFDSGMGPTAFGINLLGDRKKLSEFLGMPEDVLSTFMPKESGLLSSQLNGIYEAAAKNNNLDLAYKNMFEAANRNVDIEENLSSYIRGKDDYLGSIDKLIDQGRDIMANTDTSNPYIAKQLGNYMNYLNILHGRQNQRYINMLDLGIKSQNNKYIQATNLYTAAEKKVTDEYNRTGAVTTEFYNNTMNIVKEMYDGVASKSDAIEKAFDFEIKKIEASDNAVKRSLEILKLQNELSGTSVDYKPITNLDTVTSLMGIETDKDGNITFNNYNPLDAISIASQSQKNDPAALLNLYAQTTGTNLYQKSSTGIFEKELNAYGPTLESIYSEFLNDPEANAELGIYYTKMKNSIQSGLTNGITEFVTTNKERVRQAINILNGKGWGKPASDKTKFIKEFNDLGDIAGMLFDINLKSPQGGIGTSDIVDKNITLLIQQLVYSELGGSI